MGYKGTWLSPTDQVFSVFFTLVSSIKRFIAVAALLSVFSYGVFPAIALAATVPGTLQGRFSVDPSGGADYKIDISVPPGVAGLQPKLALLYSSRAGDGQLGAGWSLAGLSAVTRCSQTLAQDKVSGSVELDSNDRFCLDGQRLMNISTSASYWAAAASNEYRTEVETFQRVLALGTAGKGPQYFKVFGRSGLRRWYGYSADSMDVAADGTTRVYWPLNMLRDRSNNEIDFKYSGQNADYRLTEIDYSNGTGDQIGKVVFAYQARTDTAYGFVGASGNNAETSRNSLYRLYRIDVYDENAIVRTYFLDYRQASGSGVSLLASFKVCAPSGDCMPATQFNWQESTSGFSSTSGTDFGIPNNLEYMHPMDVDGDGLTDYVYVSGGTWRIRFGKDLSQEKDTGISTDNMWPDRAVVVDVNGDGRQDLLVPGPNTENQPMGGWEELISNGSTLVAPAYPAYSSPLPPMDSDFKNPIAVDINGDGIPEMLYKYGGNLAAFTIGDGQVVDNTGYPITADQKIIPIRFASHTGIDIYVTTKGCTDPNPGGGGSIDFGGGGIHIQLKLVMRDILNFFVSDAEAGTLTCWDTAGVFEWQGATSGSLVHVTDTGAGILKMDDPVFLDINGDGLTDIAYLQSVNGSINNFEWNLEINHGGKWVWQNWSGPTDSSPTNEPENAQVIDYNHDGLDDIIYPQNGYWKLLEATGNGLHAVTMPSITYEPGSMAIDVNADGITDLLYPGSTDEMVVYGNSTIARDLLANVTDGLGSVTNISYAPWSVVFSQTHETSALLTPFKIYKLLSPVPVVIGFSQDIGMYTTSGDHSVVYTSYQYWDGKVDRTGRGFLGFAKVESYNHNTGIVLEDDYAQQFPYTGMVTHSVEYDPDQAPIDVSSAGAAAKLRISCTTLAGGGDMTCDFSPSHTVQPGDPYNTAGLVAVSDTTNSLGCIQPNLTLQASSTNVACNGTVPFNFVYVQSSIKTLSDLKTGVPYKKVTDTRVYNNSGEATDVKVATRNLLDSSEAVHTVETTNNYGQDDYPNWCLHQTSDSTVEFDNNSNAVRKSEFIFSNCLLQEQQDNVQSVDFVLKTDYGYDNYGNQISIMVSAPNGESRVTRTAYDGLGLYPTSETNSLSQTSTSEWDPRFGAKSSDTDANGITTAWSYDEFGREEEVDNDLLPSGLSAPVRTSWSKYSIDFCTACAAPTAVYKVTQTDANGYISTTEYDDLDRAVFTQSTGLHGGLIDQFTLYDPIGRRYMVSDPIFANDLAAGAPICWTYDQYDSLGRVTAIYRPENASECSGSTVPQGYQSAPTYSNVTHTAYNGFVTTVTDAKGHATVRQSNAIGEILSVTDADNQVTSYVYDAFGNTKKVTDPDSKPVSMDYDSVGHKIDMSDPDMGQWTYNYNAFGELVSQIDAKGNKVTLIYDKLGRLIERDEPEGTTTWKYDIAYGAGIGKLAYISGPNGYWEGYAYNAYGDTTDKIQVVDGKQYWFTTTYNALGQLDTLLYPDVDTTATTGAPSDSLVLNSPSSSITGLYAMTWNTTQDGAVYHLYRARDNDNGTVSTFNDAAEVYSGPYGEYDESLMQTGVYRYWIEACYADTCGTPSSAVVTVTKPPQPGVFSVTESGGAGSGQFTASWGNVGAPEYRLHQASQAWLTSDTDGELGSPVYDGAAANSKLVLDDGTYYFAVSACSQVGCSNPVFLSGSVRELRKPVPPSGLTSPAGDADGSYIVSWSETDTVHSKYYELDEANNSSFSSGLKTYQITSPTESKDISRSVTSGDPTYYYRVRACNQDATGSICSSNTATSKTHVIPPPAEPVGVSVPSSNHNGTVKVVWSDGGGGTPSYYGVTIRRWRCIDYTDATTCLWSVGSETDTGNTYLTYTGLTNGNTYDFLVRACNDTACTAKTDAGSTYVTLTPGVPGTLSSSESTSTNGSYTLSWGASTGTVTDYQLFRSIYSNFSGQKRVNSTSTSRSYSESGMTNGKYYYHVRACNVNTCSSFGNSVAVTVSIYSGSSGGGSTGGGGVVLKASTAPTGTSTAGNGQSAAQNSPSPSGNGVVHTNKGGTHPSGSKNYPAPAHGRHSKNTEVVSESTVAGSSKKDADTSKHKAKPLRRDGIAILTLVPQAASKVVSSLRMQPLPVSARVAGIQSGRMYGYPPLRGDWRVQNHYRKQLGWHVARASYTPPPSSKPTVTAQMVEYAYDSYGHLEAINAVNADNSIGVRYWVAVAANAKGELQDETLGTDNSTGFGGITIGNCYDRANGKIKAIQATLAASLDPCNDTGEIESDSYSWDELGNLTNRYTGYVDSSGQTVSISETFGYDAMNRLTSRNTVANGATATGESYEYDPAGNLVQRGANTLTYGVTSGTGPTHAVTDAMLDGNSVHYNYDADGNLINGGGNSYTWSSYNKPLTVSGPNVNAMFTYAPDRSLLTENLTANGDNVQILNLGLFEVVDNLTQDKVIYRHAIEANGEAVAEIIEQSDGSIKTNYFVHDHLGSAIATLDATGHVLSRSRHGAWGEPEDTQTGIPLDNTATDGLAHQGYTGHIDLTSLGLIHMGGRVYSIPLHRFISADPNVQFPFSTQGYNRYAYVYNNPLSLTDPSGYMAGGILGTAEQLDIGRAARWWTYHKIGQQMSALLITVGSSYCGYYAALCAAGGTFDYAQAMGASTDASFRAAAAAAIETYAMKKADTYADEGSYIKASAVAYAGGYASSRITGGEGALGGRLAGLQVWLRVAMDEYSGYDSTTDTAQEGGVVKPEGTAVENQTASNTGKSIVIPPGDIRATKWNGSTGLIGKPLNELTQEELKYLSSWNKGIKEANGRYFLTWDSEGGAFMQAASQHVPITNAFSVFHDVWMNKWGVSGNSFLSSAFLMGSIPFAIYTQAAALGGWDQDHILSLSQGQQ